MPYDHAHLVLNNKHSGVAPHTPSPPPRSCAPRLSIGFARVARANSERHGASRDCSADSARGIAKDDDA